MVVKFEDTGYTTSVQAGALITGKIKDHFKPSVKGIGIVGKEQVKIDGKHTKEYNLWKEICCTFNPWIAQHWLKRRFFDNPPANATVLTTTYLCNEFLDEEDIRQIEEMRETNPRKFRIVGLGEWGVSEGLVYAYREWNELDPSKQDIRLARDYYGKPRYIPIFGLDFGFTNSP